MNATMNKFLLAFLGEKFMPKMRFRQPGFICNVCEPFAKNKKTMKKIKNMKCKKYLSKRIR